jgi:hypothetical protein
MHSLYSAFIVDPREHNGVCEWDLFNYQRSQEVTRSTTLAELHHTNVPRSGYNGLPMGWRHVVGSWRANTNIRFAEAVLRWASETSATFRYNASVIEQVPLIDLMMSPQPVERATIGRAFWMEENLAYEVIIQTNHKALEKLEAWLVTNESDPRLICWIHFDGELTRPANW